MGRRRNAKQRNRPPELELPNLLDNLILQKLPVFHKRFKPQKMTFTLKISTFYKILCQKMSK